MSSDLFLKKKKLQKCLQIIYLMYKEDLALNNQQLLIS